MVQRFEDETKLKILSEIDTHLKELRTLIISVPISLIGIFSKIVDIHWEKELNPLIYIFFSLNVRTIKKYPI